MVLLISYLSLVLGELVPKRLALTHPEAIATWIARPMELLSQFSHPVVVLLTWSTETVLTLLGQRGVSGPRVTEEDIRSLVREGSAEGAVEPHEQQLIERVFVLSDRMARQITTPRRAVYGLEADAEVQAVLETLLASGFSRFPVYEDTLDHVVGVAHIRDLLRLAYEDMPHTRVRDAMSPPLLVPDTVPVSALLATFLQTQQHMAIVVDESGAVDGIVTLEDVLEELVGEIADEHDETASHPIVRRDDGSLLIDGAIPIDEVKSLEVDILPGEEREPFDTLAGFLLSQLGHIPQLGEKVSWGGWCFEIIDMDGLRIDKVLVMPVQNDG